MTAVQLFFFYIWRSPLIADTVLLFEIFLKIKKIICLYLLLHNGALKNIFAEQQTIPLGYRVTLPIWDTFFMLYYAQNIKDKQTDNTRWSD